MFFEPTVQPESTWNRDRRLSKGRHINDGRNRQTQIGCSHLLPLLPSYTQLWWLVTMNYVDDCCAPSIYTSIHICMNACSANVPRGRLGGRRARVAIPRARRHAWRQDMAPSTHVSVHREEHEWMHFTRKRCTQSTRNREKNVCHVRRIASSWTRLLLSL